MGLSQPQVRPGAHLQARIWQAPRKKMRPHQRNYRTEAWQIRHRLHRGSDPRGLHRWSPLQRRQQLLVALQVEQRSWRLPQEDDLNTRKIEECRGARVWNPQDAAAASGGNITVIKIMKWKLFRFQCFRVRCCFFQSG